MTWTVYFNGLGLSLEGAKLVSINDRPSYSSIVFRLFPSGGEKNSWATFRTNRLEVLQGMSVNIFVQKVEDLTSLHVKIKRNLAKKMDPTLLQPSNLKHLGIFFTHKNVNVHAVFSDRP